MFYYSRANFIYFGDQSMLKNNIHMSKVWLRISFNHLKNIQEPLEKWLTR